MATIYNPLDPGTWGDTQELVDKIQQKQVEEGIISQSEIDEWKRKNVEAHTQKDGGSVWDKIKDITSTGVDWFSQIWGTVKGTRYDSDYDYSDYHSTYSEGSRGMWIGIAAAIVVLAIIIVLILKNN